MTLDGQTNDSRVVFAAENSMTYICKSSSVQDFEDVSFFGVGIPILFALCHSVVGGIPYTSEARDKLNFFVLK